MVQLSKVIFGAAVLLSAVKAHEELTPEQIAKTRDLQEQMYLCVPYIKAQMEQRKRDVQQVLGQAPTDAATMFLADAFEQGNDERKLLSCGQAEEEARIRNNTCVLTPVVTQGPYYHDRGHPIRQNMAENEIGVPFLMDIGIINVKTCEPMTGVLVDIWHANATGHYSGHPDPKPELFWEGPAAYGPRKGLLSAFPRTIDHETWLRAAWPTNKNGVAQFSSIFPGYYTGRATHVHVKVHTEWEPHSNNGTFTASRMIHVGQLFVEDEINSVIDRIHPYTENPIKNKWGRTRNWVDSLNIYQDSHKGFQATFETQKLGGVINQGLIGYMTIGVDPEASYNPTQAWTP
ncbi:hypothetical protein OIO90_001365 [Microbotryomycetes sp. JL221]|nr:hypothetical protein OIO90_001365 [Microbotryomycetes sp. JL221]